MGMLLRLMTFLKPHLEACVAGFNYRYMTRESIAEAYAILREMLEGLKIAGLRIQHLMTKLEILGRIVSRLVLELEAIQHVELERVRAELPPVLL